MTKRTRLLISMSVPVMIIGGIFFSGKPLSSAQEEAPLSKQDAPFKTYTLGVYCRSPQFPTAGFYYEVPEKAFGNKELCVGKCGGGVTTSFADALAPYPPGVAKAFRDKIAQHEADAAAGKGSSIASCLGKTKEEPKCEAPSRLPSSPWLDPDVPCAKRERGVVSWKHVLGADGKPTADIAYTVKICGETIQYALKNGAGPRVLLREGEFKMLDVYGWERKPPGARGFDVCCESWLKAANSKSPCDARQDIDCDEVINEGDRFPEIPEDPRRGSNFFVMNAPPWPTDAGYQLDPPWNYLHAPDQSECKDCKWELIKYEFTTRKIPDRSRSDALGQPIMNTEYTFKTLWKCPVTGQTKENYEVVIKHPLSPGPADGSTPPA